MSEAAVKKVYYKEKELNEIRYEIEKYRVEKNSGFTKAKEHEEVSTILRAKNKIFVTKNLNGKKLARIWMNYFDPKFNRGPVTDEENIILGDAKRSGKRIVLTKILPNRTGQWVANLLINPQFLHWYITNNSELNPDLVRESTESVGRSGEFFSQLHPAEELSPPASHITYAQYEHDEEFFPIDDDNGDPANFDTPFMLDSVNVDYQNLLALSRSPSVSRPESESSDWDDTYRFFSQSVDPPGDRGGNRMKSFIKARKSSRKAHKKSARKARKSSRKARKSARK